MRIGELADVVGVTTRAVRHYHPLGLLPEPERRANGYREYGLRHAVVPARIRRLTELGTGARGGAGRGGRRELDVEVGSETTVTLELTEPVTHVTFFGGRREVRVVRFHADDADELVRALGRARV
jgi:hypothetical protein